MQARTQKKIWGGLQNLAIQIVQQHNKTIFSSLIEIISGDGGNMYVFDAYKLYIMSILFLSCNIMLLITLFIILLLYIYREVSVDWERSKAEINVPIRRVIYQIFNSGVVGVFSK
jgi:hypothetical protein